MARKRKDQSADAGEERVEGWEGLAADEPSAGTLAPSNELEAALKEASEAVARRADSTPAESAPPDSPEALREALSQELQTLKAEYEASQDELEKTREQHLRAQADLENLRRRSLKEKQDTHLYGQQNLVKELLPSVDNLERAIEHAEQSTSEELQQLLQGVELVRRELLGVLERFGVTRIEAAGAAFDPAVHEAVAQTPTTEVEPNTVVSVAEEGYQLRDRMLRPARVVVSKAPDEPQPEPDSEQ
ncbi:MAG: nucleotide exchange factor GrpE [Myxococcota bacterium]|nr:nucleotide exchange factor GrpE [Myxococcota bacterium]